MGTHLPFVTIDFWTIFFTWCNLLILFFVAKKYFFAPISLVFEKRKIQVENIYRDAKVAQAKAKENEEKYKNKLESAREEVKAIIDEAVKNAEVQSNIIISNAKTEAKSIVEKAEKKSKEEHDKMLKQAKSEIVVMAVLMAENILKRELVTSDQRKYLDEVISEIGDNI